ncbi:hypothetical protein EV361DRAFT_866319 [Lentinula raphanica]|uniref:Uncharacterized protein n=1 Tax=Lentinula raphanica TaxID=153919 RepID=A0AA38UL28_9AGAR|nr:hypothetical protein F5878DRAFT_638768 [Lentinula raphanica]KAJ3974213.1 hypothetical protein EV361DRAFT_866319 [Lentinula raphanica]
MSALPVDVRAIPATRTVILSHAQFSNPVSEPSVPQPPSTPTPSTSASVVGTTTSDGNVMTVYGEDFVYSEFFEGQGVGNGSDTSVSWSTGTYSTPVTEHDIYAVGASAIAFSQSADLAIAPVIVQGCNFDSSTGACTEVYWFSGLSTQTTSWTGSVVPFQTIEVSVSATETGSSSSTNAARSLKGSQTVGLLAGISVVVVFELLVIIAI